MARFHPGMVCCRGERAGQGLECSLASMHSCATRACRALAEDSPERLPGFLLRLLSIFMPGAVRDIARAAGCLDHFIPAAAAHCAAIAAKPERQVYAGLLSEILSEADYSHFVELHAAEWRRIREKS
ncbi:MULTISPECIES: hypothetical protein [Cupriavidus]